MTTSLECVGCAKELPIERFSKTQRRELEPECKACTAWRESNDGDAIPTPPPGGGHALREHEKAGTFSRVLPSASSSTPATVTLAASSAALSCSNLSGGRPSIRGDAGVDNDGHYGSRAAISASGPRSKVLSSAFAAPRFSQNLPASAVRVSGPSASDITGTETSQSGRGASSNNSETSFRPVRQFGRHAYGQPNSSTASSHGRGDRSSKWPKGDNRKKFDVLPSFE
ncbi:Stc1 domain-containing protein [Microdochium nivale]|nr:Stc1 domain-containing protein [Microdochium nivale]